MKTLYTIACPELPDEAGDFIGQVRRAHDPQHDIVAAHFTLLFGSEALDEARYVEHVRAASQGVAAIDFVCRYAFLHVDLQASRYQVHLVPDEGFAAISLLRDRLATGIMAPLQGLHIGYVPHITIASLPDLETARALRDHLNRQGVRVPGRLSRLNVGSVGDGRFRNLWQHELATGA